MQHHWLGATNGTGAYVRAALLDYKKAFDLVDHNLLIAKLYSLGVKSTVVNWVVDFLLVSSLALIVLRALPSPRWNSTRYLHRLLALFGHD